MSSSGIVMRASSAMLGLAGLVCLFLPEAVADALAVPAGDGLPVQLAAAGLLALAALDWLTRSSLLGGIYGRPIVVANFVNFGVLTLVLASAQLASPTTAGIVAAGVSALFWAAFTYVLLSSPRAVRRREAPPSLSP